MADGSWKDDSWKGADWKDDNVRQAEEALAAAVRTADEIIADAQRAVADASPPEEPADPDDDAEPEEEWPVLRDAW